MKLAFFALILTAPLIVRAADTTLLFQPQDMETGPFPSNFLTEPDPAQKTGLRVKLPGVPACIGSPALSCDGVKTLLNQLDGFSLNPQFRFCFSGPIDPNSIKEGIGVVALSPPLSVIGVDQVFYDSNSHCILAKPSQVLKQSTQHLLVITNRIRAKDGTAIKRDAAFKSCLSDPRVPFCAALSSALGLRGNEAEPDRIAKPILENTNLNLDELRQMIVGATAFTTMSATDWLEKARTAVNSASLPSTTAPSVFQMNSITSWEWQPDNAAPIDGMPFPLKLPSQEQLKHVDRVAFGQFFSPNYIQPTTGTIPQANTGASGIGGTGYVPISYHVFLPPKKNKIPVVLYAHGLSDNQFGAATAVASTLAQAGYATLAFEVFGHGYGPKGVVNIKENKSMAPVTVATPGRGVSPTQARLGPTDGCILVANPIATRDCGRQSAVDVFALVRAIKSNGLGLNLDGSQIYYVGQSFGSIVGTLVHAVEPDLKAAAFSVGGDSVVDIARLSAGHALADPYLANYNYPLYGSVAERAKDLTFDFLYTYRGQVQTSDVPGAASIQTAFEVADWLNMPGAPAAFAPHLQLDPLPGVPRKPTLFQFGWGDLEVPNATETALVRATVGPTPSSDELLPVSYFRYDKALAQTRGLAAITMPGFPGPILPHRILANPTLFDAPNVDERALAQFLQDQIAKFFDRGGDLKPKELEQLPIFENPKLSDLPTLRNYQWAFGPSTN